MTNQVLLADTAEVQRVYVAVGAAIVALETQVLSALALRPVAAAMAIAEVTLLLHQLKQLQTACASASAAYQTCEHRVPVSLNDLGHQVVPALAGLLTQAAAVLPGYGLARVSAQKTGDFNQTSPTSFTQLIRRVHTAEGEVAKVRIEQLVNQSNGRQFLVYIPGTKQMDLGEGTNPLNLTNAIKAVAGPGLASSERAVSLALKKAGIGSMAGDSVTLVGYSQGATIAANLASQPQAYKVRGLVSIAGPISARPLPSDIPIAAIQHSNDLVPLLDGSANPKSSNIATAVVQTPAGFGAHDLKSYQQNALEIDSVAGSTKGFGAFNQKLQEILGPLAGKPVKGTWYEITQVPN